MKSLHHVERAAIHMMDRVVEDKLKIEWHKGGSDIRGVMLKAILIAYRTGRRTERIIQKQEGCDHVFTYNRHGGVCRFCHATTLQCSSS